MTKENIIYCEIEFWKKLSKMMSDDNYASDIFRKEVGESAYARKLFRSMLFASSICFDSNEKFIDACKNDEILLRLNKASETEGYPSIVTEENYKSICDLCEEDLKRDALFFVSENTKMQFESVGSSVLVITPESCVSASYMFKDFGKSIRNSSSFNWNDILAKAKHNCNSLMIFDNYVLKKKEDNLYKIIDVLLPNKSLFAFHLAIFTLDNGVNIQQEYEKIRNKLKELRPDLEIDFSIFKTGTNDFHDRAIMTNYIWIGSGGGFDLLNIKKRSSELRSDKTTSIPIFYPFFVQESIDWATDHYYNFMEDAKKVKKCNMHIGSGNVRLLEEC